MEHISQAHHARTPKRQLDFWHGVSPNVYRRALIAHEVEPFVHTGKVQLAAIIAMDSRRCACMLACNASQAVTPLHALYGVQAGESALALLHRCSSVGCARNPAFVEDGGQAYPPAPPLTKQTGPSLCCDAIVQTINPDRRTSGYTARSSSARDPRWRTVKDRAGGSKQNN